MPTDKSKWTRGDRSNEESLIVKGPVRIVKPRCRKIGCELYGEIHPQCRAHSMNKRGPEGWEPIPCGSRPLPGQWVCRIHGGDNESGRQKGKKRLALMEAKHLVQFDPGYDEAPEEGLLREVSWSAQIASAYGAAIADMEGGLTAYSPARGEHMRALIQAWTDERQLHARLCKLAIDAGIDRRRIDLMERLADQMIQIISAVLQDPRLGLPEERIIEAKVITVEKMRELPRLSDRSTEGHPV